MAVAEQSRGSVRIGADFHCHIRRQHEHRLGESHVDAQSSDFREGFDSEGDWTGHLVVGSAYFTL